jgi:hypothetical protein
MIAWAVAAASSPSTGGGGTVATAHPATMAKSQTTLVD